MGKTALIEGKFAGHGGTRKYRIEWPSFNPPLGAGIDEYGAQHGIFKKPGNVWYPHPKVPPGENITGPQADEECSETESDFDSSEEEEEQVVNLDEEHADSQSVEVGRRI